METKELILQEGQYLADIYPLIETNVILNKKLSGVGATHCEIIAPRHSIIVVPNIPIIACKVERHHISDNLFGVMQKVQERDIEDYLEKTISQNKLIKIMVTPESFYKVRRAFDSAEIDMYNTCFLMLDECHKFIKERDFRKDITQPFDAFFKFKNKALVSATPIIPSDPRFKEQNFKLVKVDPQYNHKYAIAVIPTDDIRLTFYYEYSFVSKGKLPSNPQCIFVNSIGIIEDLVNQSNLQAVSSIFCSEKSAVRLKHLGFNVHTEWKKEYQMPFMFFTSRFFTGLDIWLEEKPRVLYFSDAKNAEQTLMDPFTDMAQACGRFRNGMTEINHFVVFNPDLEIKTDDELASYFIGVERAYKALEHTYHEATSPIERQVIVEAIQRLPFKEMFIDHELDYFLKDNFVNFEKIKQYYVGINALLSAYVNSDYFSMAYEIDGYMFGDGVILSLPELKKLSSAEFKELQRKAIVKTLEVIAPYRGTSAIDEVIYNLKSWDEVLVDAFFKLGKPFIVHCDYNMKKIKAELRKNSIVRKEIDEAFLDALYSTFEPGKKYLRSDAKKELRRLYDNFGIKPLTTITAMSLQWHFEIDDKARIGNQKAIRIIRPKVEGAVEYFDKIRHNTETKIVFDDTETTIREN